MARAATTSDVFNAIAEPRRRQILEALAGQALAVGTLVDRLRLPQPAVSKHLGVLRTVGLVAVRQHGRRRLYELQPGELQPVHAWIARFERYWNQQLARIKARAEGQAQAPRAARVPPPPRKEHGE
jgi:DNA-binding transcriptional ArsR family regulator